jgi:hypothetical protein
VLLLLDKAVALNILEVLTELVSTPETLDIFEHLKGLDVAPLLDAR